MRPYMTQPEKIQDLSMRPVVNVINNPGGEVSLAMGIGIVAQQLIRNLAGAVHGQGRCSGIQVMPASLAPVRKAVASIKPRKVKGKAVHKVFPPWEGGELDDALRLPSFNRRVIPNGIAHVDLPWPIDT